MEIKDELIKKQEEYIEFLGRDISDNAGYLHIHGIKPSPEKISQGIKMRKEIADLKHLVDYTDI